MPEAQVFFGAVFQNGSATFLARIVGADGFVVTPSGIAAVKYDVFLLDEQEPDRQTPVPGHTDASLAVGDVIASTLQRDAIWTKDAIGYNFKHAIDVSSHQAFALSDRQYRVAYQLTPTQGQAIVVRFCVHAI
jgi:hypothetical protein